MFNRVDEYRFRQFFQAHQIVLDPLTVWTSFGYLIFNFFIRNNSFLLQIHQKHITRLQFATGFYILKWNVQYTRFR